MKTIKMTIRGLVITANLRDTPTATAIWDTLPFDAVASTWSEEVYFPTPVALDREAKASAAVDPGKIVFWPDGDSFAIGFGRSPINQSGECRG